MKNEFMNHSLSPGNFELIEEQNLFEDSGKLLVYQHNLRVVSTMPNFYKIYKSNAGMILINYSDNYYYNTVRYNNMIQSIKQDEPVEMLNIINKVYLYIFMTFDANECQTPILIRENKEIDIIKKIRNKEPLFFREYDSISNEKELLPKITKFLNYYKVQCIVFSTKTGYYYKYEIVMNKNAQVKYVKRGIVYSR